METKLSTRILDAWSIRQMLRRIAHQVLEDHYREKRIAIVGVRGIGAEIAAILEEELALISELPFDCYELALKKDNPLKEDVYFSGDLSELKGREVLLVDDVLNSGRTLSYAVAHLLQAAPKSLRTVVLVDRIHRRFPIRADYYGIALSTNLKEHVSVVKEGDGYAAYLD